jgi:hypothetical protein
LNEQYCELPAKTCACREGFIKSRTKSGVCEKSIAVISTIAKVCKLVFKKRVLVDFSKKIKLGGGLLQKKHYSTIIIMYHLPFFFVVKVLYGVHL